MVFSGAVFLYAFLPLTLAVYALAPQRGRKKGIEEYRAGEYHLSSRAR